MCIFKYPYILKDKWKVTVRSKMLNFYLNSKAPYPSKIDILLSKKDNKLIYGINTIIKCGIWLTVILQLVSRSWNEMIWINVANINSEIR